MQKLFGYLFMFIVIELTVVGNSTLYRKLHVTKA